MDVDSVNRSRTPCVAVHPFGQRNLRSVDVDDTPVYVDDADDVVSIVNMIYADLSIFHIVFATDSFSVMLTAPIDPDRPPSVW